MEENQNLNRSLDNLVELMKTANEGEHVRFHFIRNTAELSAVRQFRSKNKKISKAFGKVFNTALKSYNDMVKAGRGPVEDIVAVKQFETCKNYYAEEARILDDMVDEYMNYVHKGHLIATILNIYRPEEDLVDYRDGGWIIW